MQLPSSDSTPTEIAKPAPLASSAKKAGLVIFLELVQVLIISFIIILPVRYFLVQPFYVKGASMEPNFYDHEYLVIDEISYRFRDPQRGDIVVFRYPRNPSEYFIKRVIGLPGETVEIADGRIKIYNAQSPNGMTLDESVYLDSDVFTDTTQARTLKADEYFVLGDNREQSLDSRLFGAVPRANIVGKVWIRGYPINRWQAFHPVVYSQFSHATSQ